MSNPLDNTHPDYDAKIKKWKTVQDVYDGTIIDRPSKYLVQRPQGETDEMYDARCEYSNYIGWFQNIVDGLVGEFSKDKVERSWGRLGNPDESGSRANLLHHNIDGTGKGFDSLELEIATTLMLYNEVYILVEGDDETEAASVKVVPPLYVPNWDTEETWVRETVEVGNVWAGIDQVDQIVSYRPSGYGRYRKDGSEVVPIEEVQFEQVAKDDRGRISKPIFRVSLPIPRYVMYQLAHAAIRIFEMTSVRDFQLISASFNKLILDAHDELFDKLTSDLEDGATVLQGDGHEYISPSAESASEMRAVINEKVRQLYKVGFRSLDSLARNRTATESVLDREESTGAFLTMVANSLSEASTRIIRSLEQHYFPNEEPLGFVEWSQHFRSIEEIVGEAKKEEMFADIEDV